MVSSKLENEPTGKKLPRIEIRMLSFDLVERVEIARLLTDAGYSVRNELAANFDRFESRVTDDDWDVIFVDARVPYDSVSRALDLVRAIGSDVPVFALVDSHQENQAELMELGIADLFTSDDLQRLPGIITRGLEASDDRKIAIEARRLQNEIEFAGDERAVLAEIGRLVSSSPDIGQVYDQLVEQVKILIPLETAAIAVADVASDSVTIEYLSGRELPGFDRGRVMAMSGFTSINQLPQFVFVFDTELMEQMRTEFPGIRELLNAGVRSIMVAPLVHRDEVVGFFATGTSTENAYEPEHVAAVEQIAAQISGALANSRLHIHISRIARERETLIQIGRDAAAARDLQSLYGSVFKNLKNLLPVDRGVIALLKGEDGKSLAIEYVEGLDIEGLRVGDNLELLESSTAVLTGSQPVTVDNAANREPFDLTDGKLITAGLPSTMRTPLRARDSIVGLIAVSARDDRAFTQDHLSALERVSIQISPVIESFSLLNQVQSLAAAVETTLDLFAITDLQGVTSYLNPAGIRLIGLEEGASGVGVDLKDFMSPEQAEIVSSTGLAQASETGGWQTEISITPRNSERPIPVELLLVPVRNPSGGPGREVTTVNVFMRDLRDREALQVERREFVLTVSHELQTPLTSMKMYADMLGEGDAGELTDQQQRLVNNLKSTVDRLSRMVDDLNAVSLLEAGRFNLRTERFDLDDLVISAIEISEPAFADRGMRARMVQPGAAVTVNADRERTLQVMVNLLNNAAKYAEADTETVVTVSVTGSEVKVEVANKGPGIAEEDLQAVFESFYRSETARVSRIPGSGLGLSIARGFVEAQGGKIWAESTLGEGSTFIFTLPLATG
ncbi:MAG: GAF domain-containing protein [Chloroflexi bacterium]|nr:GAF domain-containing protein [Chloroflexota bacterium]